MTRVVAILIAAVALLILSVVLVSLDTENGERPDTLPQTGHTEEEISLVDKSIDLTRERVPPEQRDALTEPSDSRPSRHDCIVTGAVSGSDDMPLSGAEVVISNSWDDEEESFVACDPVRTDDRGRYEVKVPLPTEWSDTSGKGVIRISIRGTAKAPGRCFARTYRYFHIDLAKGPTEVVVDFKLSPGPRFHGFVLKQDGSPVSGAAVLLRAQGSDEFMKRAISDHDGEYGFPIGSHATGNCLVVAGKLTIGSSPPLPVDIDPETDFECPNLVLNGLSAIGGEAVFPDGRPIPGVEVHAFHQELVQEPGWSGIEPYFDTYPGTKRYLSGYNLSDGLTFDRVQTDPNGRFYFAGLKSGRYELVVPWHQIEGISEDIRTSCETGDFSVRIVVPCYRLNLQLLDELGRLIPSTEIHCTYGRLRSGIGQPVTGGRVTLCITPGPLMVRATAAGRLMGEERLEIMEGAYLTELTLCLVKTEPARLELKLFGPDGKPMPECESLSAMLEGAEGLLIKMRSEMAADGKGAYLLELPPDRYDIHVMPGGWPLSDRDSWLCGESAKGIVVYTGDTTSVEFHFNEGGRIEITLRPRGIEWQTKRIKLRATHSDTDRTWTLSNFSSPDGTDCNSSSLKPDVPYQARRLLPPGRYDVEVEAKGLRTFEKTVIITPAEATSIGVPLVPE